MKVQRTLGMRTHARRVTSSKRFSGGTPRQQLATATASTRTVLSKDVLSAETTNSTLPKLPELERNGRETRQLDLETNPSMNNEAQTAERSPEVVGGGRKEVTFVPRFKGAAETEARRRVRMQARRQAAPRIAVDVKPPPPSPLPPPPPTPPTPIPELSSSDEDDVSSSEDEEDAFEPGGGTAGDGGIDEFKP
jgi:hypothetical protein